MKKAIIIAILMLMTLGQLAAQDTDSVKIDPEKKTEIVRLLKAMGNYNIAEQIKMHMKNNVLNMVPNVTPEYVDSLLAKFESQEFIDMLIPVYDSYFSLEEIKAITLFFESPAGKKYQEVIQNIGPEVFRREDIWAEKIRKSLIESMRNDGIIEVAK